MKYFAMSLSVFLRPELWSQRMISGWFLPLLLLLSVMHENRLYGQSDNPFSTFGMTPIAEQPAQPQTLIPAGITPADISPWLKEIPLKTTRSGILPEESEVYYQVLAYTRDMDLTELKQEANKFLKERWKQSSYKSQPFEKFPVYVDMYQHPEAYQGRPVSMRGHLRRTVLSPAGENEFGIKEIGEVWLFTEDSQTNPTVVVVTGLPDDFPIGEHTIDRISVTGYIYRMYTYKARDAGRFAPLLVAHSVEWSPPVALGENDHSWVWMIFWGVVIVVMASLLGAFLTVITKSQRLVKKQQAQQVLPREIVFDPEEREEVKLPGKPPYKEHRS